MGRQEGPPPPSHLPPDEITRQELSSQQVRIQLALLITFLLYIAVMMLGRARSRGSSWMKLLSGFFFLVAGKVINYIPGQMSGPGSTNDLYIFWISSMAYLYAVTHEISCYTLEENGERKKSLLVDFSVVWALILASLYDGLAAPEILVPIVLLFWVVVLKFRERRQALMFAEQSSNGFSQAAKIISDFTKYQKNQIDGPVGRFLVGVREAQQMAADEKFQTNIITLGNVVDSKDWLFRRRAFHPQVLPDHVYTTQCEFDGVISVLKGKLLEEEDKKKQTENPEDPEDPEDPEEEDKKKLIIPENKIIEEAKSLEDELIKHHPNLGKILAEFWTEKLLYMALAGHDGVITAHANSLCVGGEFLTLLWALVTHAGCERIPSTLPEHQGNSPNIERDQISPSHTDMEYM